MPVYSYECKNCDIKFEYIISVEKRDDVNCEVCALKADRNITTNEFAAKTRYILPEKARREFGSDRVLPKKRPKWV